MNGWEISSCQRRSKTTHPPSTYLAPDLVEERPRRTAERRAIHVEDVVMSLRAAPGEHHRDHGEAASAEGESCRKAVPQMRKSDIASRQRDATFIGRELQPERSPDRVLKTLLQQKEIGRAKAVVLITSQRHGTVDLRAAEGLLEIKRHRARNGIDGLRKQQPYADRTIQISRM